MNTETIKERPMLFSGAMVRALLAGTKTQTRRTSGLGFVNENPAHWQRQWVPSVEGKHWLFTCGDDRVALRCPYGAEGDRLWVRETVAETMQSRLVYRADASADLDREVRAFTGWTPSIFMPRTASRLLLEITAVRCERLQDISEADAVAEGIEVVYRDGPDVFYKRYSRPGKWHKQLTPRYSYETLWESINGPDSWAANPWVWVVELRRIDANGKEPTGA